MPIRYPEFESGSYGERCRSLYAREVLDDEPVDVSTGYTDTCLTWAEYPFRYWLRQVVAVETRFLRKDRVSHVLYVVKGISAVITDDSTRKMAKWYILSSSKNQDETVRFHESILGSDFRDIEQANLAAEAEDFAYLNGLLVPNVQDMDRLNSCLMLAEREGVEVV